MMFSTIDNDNDNSVDKNVAEIYGGGWWYNNGFAFRLTGIYCKPCGFMRGNLWWDITTGDESFKYVRMSIKERT